MNKGSRATHETWSAVFWFVLGLFVCYGGRRLGLGSVTDPGPGFIFFWSGLLLALLSLILLTTSLQGVTGERRKVTGVNWEKISLVLAALVFYALFLETLGFLITTFLLMSFLLRLDEEMGRLRVLVTAGAAALGSFALFELWLKIRLPKGIFGFY